MRAVIARDNKPQIVDLPRPEAGPGEVLVQVAATALNRADLLQVAGKYPPPPGWPDTLGLELAGTVVTEGSIFNEGQRVMALVGGGGYAEYAIVPEAHALVVPDRLSDAEAGATMEAFVTAYSNMVDLAGLRAGDTVLIHAGASGVGLAATQIAKAMGATVIVTASAAKHGVCRASGADFCIDYKTEDFVARIESEYPDGVDVVVEMVGAPYWEANTRVLKKWGRLVFIGLLGGAKAEVDFRMIMKKRLTITGSTLRDRDPALKSDLIARFGQWALPLFREGALRPVVWQTLPLEQVEQAQALMGNSENAGKIVLTLED